MILENKSIRGLPRDLMEVRKNGKYLLAYIKKLSEQVRAVKEEASRYTDTYIIFRVIEERPHSVSEETRSGGHGP
jgi:hypothetical protein